MQNAAKPPSLREDTHGYSDRVQYLEKVGAPWKFDKCHYYFFHHVKFGYK